MGHPVGQDFHRPPTTSRSLIPIRGPETVSYTHLTLPTKRTTRTTWTRRSPSSRSQGRGNCSGQGPRTSRPRLTGPDLSVRRPGPGPHRRARPVAGHRPEVRAAHRLSPADRRSGRPGQAAGRIATGEGRGAVLRGLRERRRRCPLPDLQRPAPRRRGDLRGGGTQGRRRGRTHTRIPRQVPRAGRCDLADRRRRPRPAADQAAAHPGSPSRASGRSSWPPTPTSRARPRPPT